MMDPLSKRLATVVSAESQRVAVNVWPSMVTSAWPCLINQLLMTLVERNHAQRLDDSRASPKAARKPTSREVEKRVMDVWVGGAYLQFTRVFSPGPQPLLAA